MSHLQTAEASFKYGLVAFISYLAGIFIGAAATKSSAYLLFALVVSVASTYFYYMYRQKKGKKDSVLYIIVAPFLNIALCSYGVILYALERLKQTSISE